MRWRECGRWAWRLEGKPSDCWLGVFVDRREGTMAVSYHAWVCVVPMLPMHLCLTRWKEGTRG